ncbi:MAG: glycosyltransferase [Candidatus Micrarchaeota archaeon]|nr:glycosyltransferase [Candidatus Micrarchaeota archaeon]
MAFFQRRMADTIEKMARRVREHASQQVQRHLHFTQPHSHYRAQYNLHHRGDYLFIHEKISAKRTFHRESLEMAALLLLLCALALYGVSAYLRISPGVVFVAAAMAFYLSSILFKLFVFYLALRKGIPDPAQADLAAMQPHRLPVYTVLVPIYKEASSVRGLVNGLNGIAYPRSRLDIKLLVEADDAPTRAALDECRKIMGPEYQVLVLPHGHPKTKPRALNAGLLEAKGEFLTIYDAEDIPARDQLKKAAWIFRHSEPQLVALQCKLNFYNPHENLLSKWFTAEYAVWFDFVLPGLHLLNLPIPLGGTSNHFRTESLRQIGGWDPYNVAEDADLGLRICRAGGRVGMMDSTTYGQSDPSQTTGNRYGVGMMESFTLEESNTVLEHWVNQRSRWVKGYLQTFLVHARHPLQAVRDYGWRGTTTLVFLILGTPVTHALNFIFWAMAALWVLTQAGWVTAIFPEPLLTMGWVSFVVGNAIFIGMHVLAPLRKGYDRVAFWSLFIPLYWLLMAIATFKALWQLAFKPHYWEKTPHGQSQPPTPVI